MVKPIPEKSREDSGMVGHIDQKSNTQFWSRQIARDKADVHKNAKNRTTLVFTSGLTGAFDLLHFFFIRILFIRPRLNVLIFLPMSG